MTSPIPSSEEVSARMRKQRRVGTAPELAVRRLLHACGHRYRVGLPIPGLARRTIDVAFTRQRIAVFVDGCFWHACPEHGTQPVANGSWWTQKLAANVARDRDSDAHLAQAGWVVVRVWEHEPTGHAVARIEEVMGKVGLRRALRGAVGDSH